MFQLALEVRSPKINTVEKVDLGTQGRYLGSLEISLYPGRTQVMLSCITMENLLQQAFRGTLDVTSLMEKVH